MRPDQYLAHLRAVYAAFQLPFDPMPPASEQELTALAAELGPLDPDLAALWRLTAGSSSDRTQPLFQRPGFVDALDLLTPAQATAQAAGMEKRAQRMWDLAGPASQDPRLSGRWWQAGWQPFASFYGDIVLLVDQHPGPEGQRGQIIAYVHDPDQIQWIAPNFGAYLQAAADSIDADREEFLNGPLDELE
ncbi:SMI1/KNR4 family protein [Comamonas sp. Tr-654]|uniref:SMI1/KNR4 family protein n=1 Tax=Comamonas sp. Tr-654 TaxID=2608341 RepID=UPI0014203374|nr:SMI1/KNR4 family protein [Comamonas sp. Tr-654]NIF82501.1 SMI1/KNR4 family protein [Comamonas sp. Tr-654]